MIPKKTFFLVCASLALAGCGEDPKPENVSFKQDVMPILATNCLECHVPEAKGEQASGLLMNSYESLMAGTKHGPVVVPGNSLVSVFNQVVEGRVDESISMPHGGKQLSEEEILVLKTWVDEGAKNN
jgi:hypothetical protein